MKLKKIILSSIVAIIFSICVIGQNISYSATDKGVLYLGINPLMTTSPNFGYSIGDPNANTSTSKVSARIWNLIKYASPTSTSQLANQEDIFCLREGLGWNPGEEKLIKTYNDVYDMKEERTTISSMFNNAWNWEKTVDGVNQYNAILAVLDMFYTNNSSNDYKETLLNNAGIRKEEYNANAYITDSDIKAVEQAALWYFTNYGENNNLYNKTGNTGWLNYTTDGNTYTSLSDYNPSNTLPSQSYGVQRQEQVELLYNYLIRTAKQNASKYNTTTTQTAQPAMVETTKLQSTPNGNNNVIGPIKITETANNSINYDIDFIVKNGNTEITNYTLLKGDKTNAGTTNVKDLVGQNFYISIPNSTSISDLKVGINIKYSKSTLKLWTNSTNKTSQQPVVIPQNEEIEIPTELTLNKEFDLALRKYITKIGTTELTGKNSRVPTVKTDKLNKTDTNGNKITTASYEHKKDPVPVETGNIVTYKLTIYNEGDKLGRATELVDQLPTGLKFKSIVSGNFDLNNYNETTNTVTLTRKSGNTANLNPYTTGTPDSETVEITCEVTATADNSVNKVLTNVAWISEEYDAESNVTIKNTKNQDRDSEPGTIPTVNKDNMENYTGNGNKSDLKDSNYYYKGQQDDDDFEKLVLTPQAFDLHLIKRITQVNGNDVKNRIENVDVSKLNTLDENGKMITDADIKMNKEPVGVSKGDIVTYTFRIYNEGMVDGYAQEITEDIPEGLEFIWSEKTGADLKADTTLSNEEKEAVEFNQKYLWGNFVYDSAEKNKIVQVSSRYLSKEVSTDNEIPAFGNNDGNKTETDLKYKELSIKMKVVSDNVSGTTIRNEACISDDTGDDRDSDTEDWKEHPDHEDDEDHDYLILQSFDLALRKFIIAVSDDETIEDKDYLKNSDGSYRRAPVVDTSKLNTTDENGKLITTATYNHTKEPILVQPNNIVVYMLRVYNEGEMDGYASEIKDHLPPNLEFVNNEYNKKYGWSASQDGRTITTKYLSNSKIAKASEKNNKIELAYKEVPIMCKVKSTAPSNEKITNLADITEYLDENKKPATDRDSQPDNVKVPTDSEFPSYKDNVNGSYIPGQQDDDDFEKVVVKIFDLALRKWVTQAIVIENGQQSVSNTGHQPYDDPEAIVKVELNRKDLNKVVVKFRYSIRVINEGDVEGYAKEITDYVPEGLKFVAEDNPGWKDEGNNVISTRLLENTLLQPGEYADIEVLLTWINSGDNIGLKVNTAEISEDYNKYGLPDKDSTPDNKKDGEDDIDDAPVLLSISTGQLRIYFTLGFIILVTIGGGIILIKKYVL